MKNKKWYLVQLLLTGEVRQIQDGGQSWEICSAREISVEYERG